MPTSATGPSSRPRRHIAARGFTLIELLVVVVIVAVLAGAVALSVGTGDSRRVENAARRAQALVELACERAALTGRGLAFAVTPDALRFGYLADDGRWVPVQDDPADPLRRRTLGESLRLRIERDGRALAIDEEPTEPQVACFGSGELTPFELAIGPAAGDAAWHLVGEHDGTLDLRRAGASSDAR